LNLFYTLFLGLLNLRGADIPYHPFFLSYLIVNSTSFELFVEEGKISDEIRNELKLVGGEIFPYENVPDHLESHVWSAIIQAQR